MSEAALADSTQRFSALVKASPFGIISYDSAGSVRTLNPAAERLFGWAESELIGKPNPIIPQDKLAEYEAFRAMVIQGNGIYDVEVLRQRKDGSLINVSLSTAPLLDEHGCLLGSMAIYADLTARKQAEEALRQSNQRLSILLRSLPLAIVARDREGNVEAWNPEAERMFRWKESEVLGRPLPPVPTDTEGYRRLLERLAQGEVIHGEERVARRKDGALFPVSLFISPVYDGEGLLNGSIAIIRDITERKRLQAQLLHAQKLEAVGQLAGGVAHYFNNLMEVIGGYSELLFLRVEDVMVRRHVEEIQKAADRAATLTRQLLAFSRRQLLQPQVLDLNRLVAEVEERLRGVIGEGIELATMLQPEIAKVRADPDQMEHVLLSLAANAREAMPPGGRLTIETADVELDQSWAAHTPDCKPGPHVLLAVSDTGAGMDAATQARIFEPFFTTKPVGQGSGLGLATVYGIVSQSGGHIDFSSEAGRGTTFRIYLPRCEALVEPCVPAVSEPGLREGSATVLVVEDEEALRELAREFLESSGYRVLDSPNGAAALELARQYPGPIHLVLTDVIMPEMNGREMADRMAAVRPDARILFMSGYTGDAIAPFEIVDSGRRFLQKPFTRAELLEKMRELLGRETDA